MGGFLGRYREHREQSGKRMSSKTQISPTKPKKRSHSRNQSQKSLDETDTDKSGWTTENLTVPDALANLKSQIIDEPPIPPPRKQKNKRMTLERQKVVEKLETKAAPVGNPYDKLIPVEEPIIVPKKEPVHICDGHHHHVCNMVHGKVIQSNQIAPKKAPRETSHPPPLKKALSTVSLPNYDELKPKRMDHHVSKRPPARNISVMSLPTECKVTLSAATAARLENYMKRCRSFDGLAPKQLLEKLQDAEHHSDSDDSWDGTNDWHLEFLRHQSTPLKPPVEPKCRLDSPSMGRNQIKKNEIPPFKSDLKIFPSSVLREIAERRESIDDFFETKAANPCDPENEPEEPEPKVSLGKRGSDAFFQDPRVLMDNSLRSNIYHTNAFLESESQYAQRSPPPKIVKEEPSKPVQDPVITTEPNHVLPKSANGTIYTPPNSEVENSDEGNDTNTKTNIEMTLNSVVEKFGETDNGDLLDTFKEFYSTHKKLSDKSEGAAENEKAADVKHSNLLKIIQENSKSVNDDVEEEMKFKIPEPLRSALVDVDKKISQIDAEKQTTS